MADINTAQQGDLEKKNAMETLGAAGFDVSNISNVDENGMIYAEIEDTNGKKLIVKIDTKLDDDDSHKYVFYFFDDPTMHLNMRKRDIKPSFIDAKTGHSLPASIVFARRYAVDELKNIDKERPLAKTEISLSMKPDLGTILQQPGKAPKKKRKTFGKELMNQSENFVRLFGNKPSKLASKNPVKSQPTFKPVQTPGVMRSKQEQVERSRLEEVSPQFNATAQQSASVRQSININMDGGKQKNFLRKAAIMGGLGTAMSATGLVVFGATGAGLAKAAIICTSISCLIK